MSRYFIEVAYLGTGFAGFQKQANAPTIQSAIEDAMRLYYRAALYLTGSSRTDAGVHALQNYFHFDTDVTVHPEKDVYHLNALLPPQVVIRALFPVDELMHSRFSAVSRSYRYLIYDRKDPFYYNRAYHYPYTLDELKMQEAAERVLIHTDFASFSKKHSQAHTSQCAISQSCWVRDGDLLMYEVTGNRFLRGMVRGLTATMLKVGRGKMRLEEFESLLRLRVHASADFSVPAHGLYLTRVSYDFSGVKKLV